MMKFLLTLILLTMSCAFSAAHAQFEPRDLTLEEQLGLSEEEEKPETPEYKKAEFIKRYYIRCLSNPTPALPSSAQETLCSCAALNMDADMTLPEIEGLFTPVPKSAAYRRKFMTEIYANCLKYPMRNFVLDDCLRNLAFRNEVKEYRQVCECTADTVGRYFNQMGTELMTHALDNDWDDPDPLMSIISKNTFGTLTSGYLRRCVQIHVFGLK